MKYIIGIIVIAVLLFLGAVYLFSDKTHATVQSCKNMNIIAFGDSLTQGYGATQGHDYPSLLSAQLGTQVQNFGHNGETSADGLARIQDVINAHPNVVIVLFGGNDALQKVPQATTQQNISKIISTLQQANIRVVLVGVLGGIPVDPYGSMFKDLTKQYNVPLVPNILSGLIGNNQYMSDEVHPNDAGYAKVAAKILPVLEEACIKK